MGMYVSTDSIMFVIQNSINVGILSWDNIHNFLFCYFFLFIYTFKKLIFSLLCNCSFFSFSFSGEVVMLKLHIMDLNGYIYEPSSSSAVQGHWNAHRVSLGVVKSD